MDCDIRNSKRNYVVGGLAVNVYFDEGFGASTGPVVGVFLLHGRYGSAQALEPRVRSILQGLRDKDSRRLCPAIVITFDHRNHGTRLVDPKANQSWKEGSPESNNDHNAALDMYSIQTGTAKDVSSLIDFLPSFLFPLEERIISQWVVAGISLGGHSTWISLTMDKRVTTGIPIIGCPDYLALMSGRAKKAGIPFAPPYVPESLLQLIRERDPASSVYYSLDESNPFLGKKVLVLSGADDKLVPWSATERFIEKLEVGKDGVKKVVVAPGVGHECTEEMIKHMVDFLAEEVLNVT